MNKEIEIPAVHDDDIRHILDRFGISEKIDKGLIICANCKKPLTWDNLYAIKIKGESLIFYCDSIECIEESSK